MKNVTVTMEDPVAEWARVEAARRNTSVSRMVGEMLAEKMRHDDAYERAMREALEFRSWGRIGSPAVSAPAASPAPTASPAARGKPRR
jgi:hypothetical protein